MYRNPVTSQYILDFKKCPIEGSPRGSIIQRWNFGCRILAALGGALSPPPTLLSRDRDSAKFFRWVFVPHPCFLFLRYGVVAREFETVGRGLGTVAMRDSKLINFWFENAGRGLALLL
ncbi:hypothetical protein TNCV_4949751 [Trichonephila clavipes]|nr:hypothetical protein TNCV_4949751 [Trichonephila clavipes]